MRSWRQHLRDYPDGVAGRPVADMTSADIQAAVMPLWTTKHKMAQKPLRRIGNVMQWAITQNRALQKWRTNCPTRATRDAWTW